MWNWGYQQWQLSSWYPPLLYMAHNAKTACISSSGDRLTDEDASLSVITSGPVCLQQLRDDPLQGPHHMLFSLVLLTRAHMDNETVTSVQGNEANAQTVGCVSCSE
jgi:hypothetical protein